MAVRIEADPEVREDCGRVAFIGDLRPIARRMPAEVEAVREDRKNLHLGVYPPLGRVFLPFSSSSERRLSVRPSSASWPGSSVTASDRPVGVRQDLAAPRAGK